MLEQLLANGRSRIEATVELSDALKHGALKLFDLHEPPWEEDHLLRAALRLIDAFRQNAKGAGAVPFGDTARFSKGVVALRMQFDLVFGLAVDPDSTSHEAGN
jgi:hypothetical protein